MTLDTALSDKQLSPQMDYSTTINLPKPDVKNGEGEGLDYNEFAIPQRASLPLREPKILQRWEDIQLYQHTILSEKRNGAFILHDGPPYSNGHLHLGHALNKILKDIVVKSKSMQCYVAPYVPGWDNHGLPIETAVSKEYREKKVVPTPVELRKRCREYAKDWVDIQKSEFQRLGINGEWDNPYLTMAPDFEAEIVATFGELVDKGYIYRGLKPVHWCPVDRTALADAEIEYADKDDPSIYVRFALESDLESVLPANLDGGIYAVIWTTTPWTIPANLALAVHPEQVYVLIKHDGDHYLVASELATRVAEIAGWREANVVLDFEVSGAQLVGLKFKHPLYDRLSPIVTAAYVTVEDGTGIVHTAPGHGRDDFETGQKNNLDVLSPVDDGGKFTAEAGERFFGQSIWDGNKSVIEALKEVDALVGLVTIRHSYPHCWRCHNPVIFRATRQWFMSIDHNGHRDRCLEEIKTVNWYPEESINRITAMVSGRPDWCLSRQRIWGVGIPVFYCQSCDSEIMEKETISHVEQLIRENNSDVWFEREASELLPVDYLCPNCGASEFVKETDIFDVWFDSGSTNRAVLRSPRWPKLHWPAEVYLEGGDQHRGWFMSSLMIGVATLGSAPYREVITNGWTLDEKGKKFSKSVGNGVAPEEVISKFGADVLRLWVASTDYFDDVRVGNNILDQTVESYRRLRNTLRFGLSNLYDFDPAQNSIAYSELREIDQYALHRLAEAVRDSVAAYNRYEFLRVVQVVHRYATVDLSAFYFDILKDTLYAEGAASYSRRSAQTVIFEIISGLTAILAPILSFTCDEVWEKLPVSGYKAPSVQLTEFPNYDQFLNPELAQKWQLILKFREDAYRAIEIARQNKEIGKPLEAHIIADVPANQFGILDGLRNSLHEILLVSQVDIIENNEITAPVFTIKRSSGIKCKRCWLVKLDVSEETGICGRCEAVVRS